ncbi:hypothetical protein GGD63_005277 [Bradyrhizobium sp. cir1]|uniref:hypothetical protein n=1 Tax=Bradyrhizobium sp. cir1 TaxID=1445730 RepID=UPI0016069DAE|nr:hypothetical protein [Bradyrhizobium sp. cir1]MBB4372469.1 hypothetical protein [Bradyrhizobium sp. cir1]
MSLAASRVFILTSAAAAIADTAFARDSTSSRLRLPKAHRPMRMMCPLAVLFALEAVLTTAAFAKTPRAKVVTVVDVRQAPPRATSCGSSFVCRQDLFDRSNRNNLRFDWPAPPAQPGQF